MDLTSVLPDTCRFEPSGTRIGARAVTELAEEFGTPLYIYDADTLRGEIERTRDAFAPLNARVSFAAKSCSTTGVLRTIQQAGLDLDAVSEGEMVAAFRAGFTADRVHLHGNCKSDSELRFAVKQGIRSIVADSAEELLRIASVCIRLRTSIGVSLRLSLELQFETHPHLRTSGLTSKFGIARGSVEESRAIQHLQSHPELEFCGLHCHAGSQITDPQVYANVAAELIAACRQFKDAALNPQEVSIGGGWAVRYTPDAAALSPQDVARTVAPVWQTVSGTRLAVEPGRALIARAGLAVYRVGSIKNGPNGRVVAVDGGMADNPRPATYGAIYSAFCANRPLDPLLGGADIVGRYCEGGDVIATGVPLPHVELGDTICVPVSGAYQLSMASNYNLVPRPAVIMIHGGQVSVLTARETIDSMLSRDTD